MSNQLNEPLIRVNWLRLKGYITKGLSLIRKLGEGILKIILKILTAIVLGFLAVYKRFSRFGKSKQKGIWILTLIAVLLWMSVFIVRRERKHLNFIRENNQKYEMLLNDYDDLYIQINEIENKMKTQSSAKKKVVVPIYNSSKVEDWRYLIVKYFHPEQVENAMSIMSCESKGNPSAVNYNDAKITGHPSCGLFQINGAMNWDWDNPETNVDRAVTMFYARGWQPWSNCAKKLRLI